MHLKEFYNLAFFIFALTAITICVGETGTKRLLGVNRSGSEFNCVKGNNDAKVFDGPTDDNAIDTMKTWKINVVRVPLNEDCWLGINGHDSAYSGENYRKAIIDFVTRLRSKELSVILELHWTDGLYDGPSHGSCNDYSAKCQKPMPDKENAPKFWESVATQFKNDNDIIFDLFNEPFPDRAITDSNQAWKCWRDGGSACPGFNYEVAGMQDLVNAVRNTGAKNLLMLGGLSYSNDLSRWMEHVPEDREKNIAASWHSYNFNTCKTESCWNSQIAPVASKYRLIVGEIGEDDCEHDYIDGLMKWLDERHISYLGWTWNAWDCKSGPSLIQDYNGTPTEFGKGFKEHLAVIN